MVYGIIALAVICAVIWSDELEKAFHAVKRYFDK